MEQNPNNLRARSLNDPESLYPTGRCFDDALDCLSTLKNTGVINAKLVHAFCLWSGQPFSHAWVEMDGHVFEGKYKAGERIYYAQPLVAFYREMQVVEPTHYSISEAAELNERFNHFGPWDQRYVAGCARTASDFF